MASYSKVIANIWNFCGIWLHVFESDNYSVIDRSFCYNERIRVEATLLDLFEFYVLSKVRNSVYGPNKLHFLSGRRREDSPIISHPVFINATIPIEFP